MNRCNVNRYEGPQDKDVAEQWGHFSVPNPVPVIDGLLAATAMVHDLRDVDELCANEHMPI
jgi:hypothetical protein